MERERLPDRVQVTLGDSNCNAASYESWQQVSPEPTIWIPARSRPIPGSGFYTAICRTLDGRNQLERHTLLPSLSSIPRLPSLAPAMESRIWSSDRASHVPQGFRKPPRPSTILFRILSDESDTCGVIFNEIRDRTSSRR